MIDLYLVTGFLGAGKTTLMKNLIKVFQGAKVAVIVNDFAAEGVDGSVLADKDFLTKEIVDGSIFCSCRSDKFIEALIDLNNYDIDYILVESSGLADPYGMSEIMNIIQKLIPESYHYSGSICVVDAKNFYKVFETASVIKHQISGADLIIVNKTDLVNHDELNKLSDKLRKLNKFAAIKRTVFSNLDTPQIVYNLKWHNPDRNGYIINRTVGVSKYILYFDDEPVDKLEAWMKQWTHLVYRAKGFCIYNDHRYYIQSVGDKIEAVETDIAKKYNYIVVLSPAKDQIKIKIKEEWQKLFNSELSLKQFYSLSYNLI